MGWLFLLVLILGAVVLYLWSSAKTYEPTHSASKKPSRPAQPESLSGLAPDEDRIRREIEAEAARMLPELKAEAARIQAEIEAEAIREADELAFEDEAESDEEPRRVLWRQDYVPKEDEARYLGRKADGLPNLYLAYAGDRLAIWSPVDSGGIVNPKRPALRHIGLYGSYARGTDHHRNAYRAADLSTGSWVDLVRELDNPHDKNAVAMCAPGSRTVFGYVQRGRAPAVARRMDEGEAMTAVSMRGPGKGCDDESTFVLIGSQADLTAMLEG